MAADFPIYKDEERQTYLSYFYEMLARYLLHMQILSPDEWLSSRSGDHFDLLDEHLCAYIEVKGASNQDPFKLFEDQLGAQLEELGFPIEDAIVWIFSYRNKETKSEVPKSGKRNRLLKHGSGKSWKKLSRFLAEQTNIAFAIDIRILKLLYQENGTRPYRRDAFRERHTVNVRRRDLRSLTENARTTLAHLGFSEKELSQWLPPGAQSIRPRQVRTEFQGNQLDFTIFPILPNGTKQRFLRRLNGNIAKERAFPKEAQ